MTIPSLRARQPAKSGTTWTMNIFHQLRTGGDPDFKDIYAEVPWLEFKERPDQPDEELLERWAALPGRRAFKTHAYPGPGPGPRIAFQADVKYIVVLRDPREALVSFRFFMAAQHDDVYDRFEVPHALRTAMTRPTFPEFFREVVLAAHWDGEAVPGGLLTGGFFDFVNAWWSLRAAPNVLLLHFNEMKADHEGSLKRIAAFLGYRPDAESWSRVVEYTSFAWMKRNQHKFEGHKVLGGGAKLLKDGAMIRKGLAGRAREDGMTPEIEAEIHALAARMVTDDAARDFLFHGPPSEAALPPP